LKIVCSGNLIRYPLGGFSWHHLQYLVGFARLGHEVTYVEDYGWADSCYDPARGDMTSDPSFGIAYLLKLLRPHSSLGLDKNWCYLAEDGAAFGLSRERIAKACRECDVFFNLSNINWIPEFELCPRRALVDTDPVFTQIGGHGMSESFAQYDALFTYGENAGKSNCSMPTAGARWQPTRQPVTVDLWPVTIGEPSTPFTTVMNWSAYGDREYEGRIYGQKDREFAPFFSLPNETGRLMEIALNAPGEIRERLAAGGWWIADPGEVTRDPWTYQDYLRFSRAEFSVAKHAYVSTRCGWFSDRSAGYLAMGRPVVVQDTGFSDFLPCGKGLLTFTSWAEAVAAIERLGEDYEGHCRAARAVAEEFFDARKVLPDLLERSFSKAGKESQASLGASSSMKTP
jgi:hypothetical protein